MLCPRGRKGSLERGRGTLGVSGIKSKSRLQVGSAGPGGGGGSARRLLPHNLMASLAEDCSTPSDRYGQGHGPGHGPVARVPK